MRDGAVGAADVWHAGEVNREPTQSQRLFGGDDDVGAVYN